MTVPAFLVSPMQSSLSSALCTPVLSSARTGSWTRGPGRGGPAKRSPCGRVSKEQELSGAAPRGSGGQVALRMQVGEKQKVVEVTESLCKNVDVPMAQQQHWGCQGSGSTLPDKCQPLNKGVTAANSVTRVHFLADSAAKGVFGKENDQEFSTHSD